MRQALSLTEVLVSVMLLTVVIATVLEIQQNNIFYLDKFKTTSLNNSYISVIANSNVKILRNKSVILSDEIDFMDDDIRKEFKEIKISIKDSEEKAKGIPDNNYIKSVNVVKSVYSIGDVNKKIFYSFELKY